MAFYPQYPTYQPYYGQPVPDQLAQLRQNQFQQQPVVQPAQMPITNQLPQPTPQSGGINWVNSKLEADNWPIAPGCAVALWDSNNPVIYLRQADSTGKPSTKVYDLVERTDNPPSQPAQHVDWDKVVTWDKLDEYLSERLKKPSRPTKPKEDE